jgi:hypothetical protein
MAQLVQISQGFLLGLIGDNPMVSSQWIVHHHASLIGDLTV